MADTPGKPKDDGKIGQPSFDGGMDKVFRKDTKPPEDAKEEVRKKKKKRKPKAKPEPEIEATKDEPQVDDDNDATGDGDKDEKKSIRLGAGDGEKNEDAEILARIRKRFERCIAFEDANRKAALEDLKFKKGDQWPADIMAQRAGDKRPCLTVNKLPTFIHQVTNDQRQNRPGIDVAPVGERGDEDVAKMYKGMIRAIERDSSADIAYDTAFESAVSMGWGYFRIMTEYDEHGTLNQVLTIKRIRNPFTVYLDPSAQEPEGSDARFGFVTEMIPRTEFEEENPEADLVSWDMQAIGETAKPWIAKDEVRVAEYYEITSDKRKLLGLSNGAEVYEDELSDATKKLIEDGDLKIENERDDFVPKLMWYKVTAHDILDREESVFKWIPIIRVLGDETDIEGKPTWAGVIRNAKDAQRQYNYWVSSETELVALAPKSPFIVEEGQIEGHESQWKNANIKNMPYLSYKGTSVGGSPAPPPQRQPPVQVPAGVVQAKQGAAQDMMATTGIRFDATLQERMVDESGRAITELQRKGDIGSFHYMDNLTRSLKHAGRILVDAIPKVYDTKRTLMILREDGKEENVTLDPMLPKPFEEKPIQGGMKKQKIFNPKIGKYGVTVVVGPSYATKRQEAATSMLEFAKALPNTAQLISDKIAKNMNWEGAEEIAERLERALPPNLITPDIKDIPPQLQAVFHNLQNQIQTMGQQMQGMAKELEDKKADQQIKVRANDQNFEAKILDVVERANANAQAHAAAQLKEVLKLVGDIRDSVEKEKSAKQDTDKKDAA